MRIVYNVFLVLLSFSASAQFRDSIVTSQETVTMCHDSIVFHTDTFKVPVLNTTMLQGMYIHPNDVTIGSASSENTLLTWCKREKVNMLNCYARSFLYTESNRTKLASFVKKAKEQYGIIEVSVDVRLTKTEELPGWIAYMTKYSNTISSINALAEFEPYTKNEAGIYDYPHFFYLLQTMDNLANKYSFKFDWYEGWIGNNYSNPQGAVDSMVKHCDRIFISNYVSSSSFEADSWGGSMDKRTGGTSYHNITTSAKRQNKIVPIVEIISLERKSWGANSDFTWEVFACPVTAIQKCHSFYGSKMQQSITDYNSSPPDVLLWTDYVGRTMFYSKYAKLAHP